MVGNDYRKAYHIIYRAMGIYLVDAPLTTTYYSENSGRRLVDRTRDLGLREARAVPVAQLQKIQGKEDSAQSCFFVPISYELLAVMPMSRMRRSLRSVTAAPSASRRLICLGLRQPFLMGIAVAVMTRVD